MLILWSGGCDSTLALYRALTSAEVKLVKGKPEILGVRTLSINLRMLGDGGGRTSERQQFARDRIKANLAKRGFVFESTTLDLPNQALEVASSSQPALWATLGAQNLKCDEDMHVGWIRSDDIWHHGAEARAVFDSVQRLTGRTGKLVAPLEWNRKADVLEELATTGLLPFTWTCEHTPSATATRGCGTCRPCRTHALAQHELKTWPPKVIPDA